MKTFLVIGVGSFGFHLIQSLAKLECETLVVDKNEEKLEKVDIKEVDKIISKLEK